MTEGSLCHVGKNIGNFEVGKLHNILLFKADCNSNNKWLGRAFMHKAELANALADKQYSSCCFKDAITQCLNKQLWYNYVCICKELAALCSNDAQSCYDCIILLIAVLCMCQLGALQPSVFSMINTLYGMQHHTCMAHGDSTRYASQSMWIPRSQASDKAMEPTLPSGLQLAPHYLKSQRRMGFLPWSIVLCHKFGNCLVD